MRMRIKVKEQKLESGGSIKDLPPEIFKLNVRKATLVGDEYEVEVEPFSIEDLLILKKMIEEYKQTHGLGGTQ